MIIYEAEKQRLRNAVEDVHNLTNLLKLMVIVLDLIKEKVK